MLACGVGRAMLACGGVVVGGAMILSFLQES